MTIDGIMNMTKRHKTAPIRPGQLSIRRQRIECWAYKGRNTSISNQVLRSSATLKTSLIQKRSENSLFQADRRLNMYLYQLGEEREKLLERYNFDQKLFANKQALLHKDNQDMIKTLDYVRKCCKYSNMDDNEEKVVDPTIFFEENHIPLRSLASIKPTNAETLIQHNIDVDENSKRHVQFQTNTQRGSQSAHASRKSHSSSDHQRAISTHGIRTINSAPPITTIDYVKEAIKTPSKPKRPSSRIFSTKNTLRAFSRYPERFLSKSNRYLPLLRRQAVEIESNEFYLKKQRTQSTFDGSDVAYDDAKSFLSEEVEAGKSTINSHVPGWDSHIRRKTNKFRAPNKINLMETPPDDNTTEYKITLSRLRDREYANLQKLIHSNSIENILKPFSKMKTIEDDQQQSMNLNEILHSIDSLNYSTKINKHKQKKINIEKNLSKFGILIS